MERPERASTHRLFKDRVLSRLGPDTGFASQVESLEKTADVLAAVAANPNAIGYVSLGLLKSDVRPVALASQLGGEATVASIAGGALGGLRAGASAAANVAEGGRCR